jgi:hypothetical protein
MSSKSPAGQRRRVASTAARRRRRQHSWFDAVAVERALEDWFRGSRPVSVGRTLSRRERRVVLHALLAVGESMTAAQNHLGINSTVAAELRREPQGAARALHRRDVAAAVAVLVRLGAPERIATRRHPLSSGEVERVIAFANARGHRDEEIAS